MAKLIGGFASSHSPLMRTAGEYWLKMGEQRDPENKELISTKRGSVVTFKELLAEADPAIKPLVNAETLEGRAHRLQTALDQLQERFTAAAPDVAVIIGADQDELFFDDNYPAIHVYWGDTLPAELHQIKRENGVGVWTGESKWVDLPVESKLAEHVIESLIDQEFDVSQGRYLRKSYGGSIGPAGYVHWKRETAERPMGIGHAMTWPIERMFGGRQIPIVPVNINACYPPNWMPPKRAYAFGRALGNAVRAWGSDARVALVTSGGLSHFVVDEAFDRQVLAALTSADGTALASLPRVKLQSASTEILCWTALAAALEGTPMEVLAYEPCYRTAAGTGVGCCVGHWKGVA